MAPPKKILIQLDPDPHASVFDAVVAIDSDVDVLLQYAGVEATQVRELIHGAMFTRGPEDLRRTAVFVGGSDVSAGEALLQQAVDCFFGPMRVSVMLDASGANTTAAAAVLCAARHVDLQGVEAAVLAATGPVGQRVARLLAQRGAKVRVCSRSRSRAAQVCEAVAHRVAGASLTPLATSSPQETAAALDGAVVAIAAGAAGVELLPQEIRHVAASLQVAIDLNAVPPVGIEGVEITDKAKQRDKQVCYGAIGVGGLKMKIHKAAIRQLFEANNQVLDAEQILAIGQGLEK